MYRIDTAGAVNALPAPAVVGVMGYFNPTAGGGIGTVLSADWANTIQEELVAIVLAGGIALDKTNPHQVLAALKSLFGTPNGQCQLQYSSNVALNLMPSNGNLLKVNGKTYALPAGGVAIANAGIHLSGVAASNLVPSTVYLVYAMDDGAGNLIPDFWPIADGHLTDVTAGNIGVEVRRNPAGGGTPDSTRSLIGMVATDGGAHFNDADGQRMVLSWFNRQGKRSRTNFSAGPSTSSNTPVELSPSIRNSFLAWAGATLHFIFAGHIVSNYGAANTTFSGISFDGGTIELETGDVDSYGVSTGAATNFAGWKTSLTEGLHYATVMGATLTGGTSTWSSGNTPGFCGQACLEIGVQG